MVSHVLLQRTDLGGLTWTGKSFEARLGRNLSCTLRRLPQMKVSMVLILLIYQLPVACPPCHLVCAWHVRIILLLER